MTLRPKAASGLIRPHLNVYAMIVHGQGTYFFIADEHITVGANFHCECIMMGLQRAISHVARKGRKLPLHLHIQCDNTTAAIKNGKVSRVLMLSAAASHFQTVSTGMLPVGHSHIDVDGLFGVISDVLESLPSGTIESRDDVQRSRPEITTPSCASWIKPDAPVAPHAL